MATRIRFETREISTEPLKTEASVTLKNTHIASPDLNYFQVAEIIDKSTAGTSIRMIKPTTADPEIPFWRIISQTKQEPLIERITFNEVIPLLPGQTLTIRRSLQETLNFEQLVIGCRLRT